ncbi:hypothetical protein ALT_5498 [Aspergillus lentulus]|uniref:Uncharacterized protein n=1 Tax=Aspergillus lentulus TaxID=293939 RepID=A0AAN4PK57_ASPLE|nr:hypothetical protein ALT_5498 [Aspergillus lentulus]
MISPGTHVGTIIEFVSVGSDGDIVAVSDPAHEIAHASWTWIPSVNRTCAPLPWESVPVIVVSPGVRSSRSVAISWYVHALGHTPGLNEKRAVRLLSHPGGWQDANRSSAGAEIRMVIEVHSGGCTKGVVRAGREVVVVLVLEKLVSLASMFAALTLAREARARNLIYMDTRME